ncbi:hypothetical protein [Sphingomonas sp. T9W2]|uniref:hypothetical protein n=1 Tax=Sphingomonas sp. T9W2 TaxID=3143183 RepID=UPI0031F4B833
MKLLRTQAGFVSVLWIVSIKQRPQGDWTVTYSVGSGVLDTICSGPDGHMLLATSDVIKAD